MAPRHRDEDSSAVIEDQRVVPPDAPVVQCLEYQQHHLIAEIQADFRAPVFRLHRSTGADEVLSASRARVHASHRLPAGSDSSGVTISSRCPHWAT
jgi:hypothetical protein